MDLTSLFSPAAFGSWNPPNQSMAPSPGTPGAQPANMMMPLPPGVTPQPVPGGPPGGGQSMSLAGGAPGGGGNLLAALFRGGAGGAGGSPFASSPFAEFMSRFRGGAGGAPMNINPSAPAGGSGFMSGVTGNPLMAKFGSALMQGQNPLQAMMSNPGDFAKWAAQRRAAVPGATPQANPAGLQPPVPTQNPGMLGGLY